MTDDERATSPDDIEFLARWTLETRKHPSRFARGAELLEREFSFDRIRERREQHLRAEIDEAERGAADRLRADRATAVWRRRRELRARSVNTRDANAEIRRDFRGPLEGTAPPFLEMLRRRQREGPRRFEREHGQFTVPRDEVIAWARERPPRMSSVEAEAVLLVAVFLYDNEPTPNPSLPPTLQRIPVGKVDPPGEDPHWLAGREIIVAMHGYGPELLLAARWAASRIEAQLPDAPPRRLGDPQTSEPNREDRAYGAFLVACRESKELNQDIPGNEHHDWLKEHRPELLTTRGDRTVRTWLRYARGGRKKHKGPVRRGGGTPTRSVVRARDLDHERDADS